MSLYQHFNFQKRTIPGFAAMLLLLVAVLVKAAFPVGFMPSFDSKSGLTEIVICSGMGEKIITIPSDFSEEPTHQDDQSQDKLCAFQLLTSAKALLDTPSFTIPVHHRAHIPLSFAKERTARAPLNLSFAARGPPLA